MVKDKDEKDPTSDEQEDSTTANDPKVKDETDKSKIKIAISRDPEIDALQKELATLRKEHEDLQDKSEKEKDEWATKESDLQDKIDVMTADKEKRALEMFEDDKESVIKLCKDSNLPEEQINEIKEKLDSPQKLETVKSLVEMLVASIKKPSDDGGQTNPQDDKTKKSPTGRATIEAPPTTVDSDEENATKIIDDIYNILNNPQLFTPQQVKEAQNKRLTLVNSMIKGKSWEQLRKNMSLGTRVTMTCPKCGNTVVGERVPERCPNCGFDFRKTGDMEQSRR